MQKEKNHIFALTVTSAMIALSVVFCRFLGFSAENTPFRFEMGFLPIALTGYMFGPLYSGVGYLIADIIGSLFSGYAPNPWISLCQLLTGAVMGFAFYKKSHTLTRTCIGFSVIAVFIDFLAKAPIFIFLYGYTPLFAFGARAINAFLNLPIRVLSYYILAKALKKPMDKLLKTNSKTSFREFANSFQAVTVPGLERIGALTEKLGHPERALKFIHVAGTNGKGSVSAYMERILSAAGYKVGKYISPNLIKVNERISVSGTDITDEELQTILDKIEPLAKEVEAECGIAPTQFEIWTAAAFVYFSDKECDFVVLEVGLGGEFDATNVIPTNEIAIITRLDIDHTQYLGTSIEEIAKAKAGIIKKGCATATVVTVNQVPEALGVLESTALDKGCTLTVADPVPTGRRGIYESFSVCGIDGIVCGIAGYHQIENAALAVIAAKRLGISDEHIKQGIYEAKNPARFELVSENPPVIFDGGHNENGIGALCASLEAYYKNADKTVIFACMRDKEIRFSLEKLNTGNTEFVFTTVKNNPRASGAQELYERARSLGFDGKYFEELSEAYAYAISRGALTVICGSLYLYKDFMEMKENI